MVLHILRHALLILSWLVGWTLFSKMRFLEKKISSRRPLVSMIVPARNEEMNIGKILNALKSQTYENLEIIVVNDNSTDQTKQIVQSFEDVKLVDLSCEPPEGWAGKSWACWNGYLNSSGEILIFMDADVEPHSEAVESLVALQIEHNGLVSIWPYQRFERFHEHLSLPFNMLVIGSMGSFSHFKARPIGAYGPVVVVGRRAYEETQGHAAFKDGVLEDIKLGRLFLQKGYRVENYLGGQLVKFRMYPQGIRQLFEGFSKNMALGASSLGAMFFLVFFWMVGLYSASGNLFFFPYSLYYFLFAVQIYSVSRKTGDYTVLDALLYPVHYMFFLIVFFVSLYKVIFLKRVEWKGRKIRV
ncbi:MAG: glycosyltransferase family 2 protein [Pseudothermotoga sp.]|uniref:glycosyltransferase n=1 Tax=Pseudothermotoga sp. TaxID=2033661 RepID=UPI000B33F05C|nr:glycosyltransferase family 2 protein [Pseudothermotoga sp.]